jgi:4-oxalocrotonate tautomerase
MPYFNLAIGQPVEPETRAFLARSTTALIADMLGKRAEVTAVRIDDLPAGHWFVAGEAAAVHGTPLQATLFITAGTNTTAEKAAFVAQLDRLLRDTFGEVPEASYIVIHEVAADDWGYGGQTQAARRLARNLSPMTG